MDRISKQKEKEFEEAQQKLNNAFSELKAKEENIKSRLSMLTVQEEVRCFTVLTPLFLLLLFLNILILTKSMIIFYVFTEI